MLWMWADMDRAATQVLSRDTATDRPFLEGKIATAAAPAAYLAPLIEGALSRILAGAPPHLDLSDAMFD
jgi:hypothetical protein